FSDVYSPYSKELQFGSIFPIGKDDILKYLSGKVYKVISEKTSAKDIATLTRAISEIHSVPVTLANFGRKPCKPKLYGLISAYNSLYLCGLNFPGEMKYTPDSLITNIDEQEAIQLGFSISQMPTCSSEDPILKEMKKKMGFFE